MLRLESIAHNLGMMKISNMAIMLDLVKSRKKILDTLGEDDGTDKMKRVSSRVDAKWWSCCTIS